MPIMTRRLAASACLLSMMGALPLARAETKRKTKARARSGAGSRGVRLKPAPQSIYANGDTPAERQRNEDERLRRECRGRPNAGACLGYVR